nr:hypothetical protein [Enterococcus cecorum]
MIVVLKVLCVTLVVIVFILKVLHKFIDERDKRKIAEIDAKIKEC